ncbi:isochorismatase family cysteine hydrolase [Chryseomicrobium sp. FSL W7-1435]|uniref:cysteine hydrolase family protein n=1 Tax=Chryseomicrobium sp. FSL W7-1435 TaxID=2921704 RepID=UPI003159E9D6
MTEALLVVDYTHDFVAEDGALTCGKPGQAIESKIVELCHSFKEADRVIVFPVDLHFREDPFHPESPLFPPHNIEGTLGRKLYGSLDHFYQENQDAVYWMDKRRYSSFAGTNLDQYLRERHVTTVHIVGVCTDICVLHTAVDAYNLGYQIIIHKDAVASFDPQGHEWALRHFETTLGAILK